MTNRNQKNNKRSTFKQKLNLRIKTIKCRKKLFLLLSRLMSFILKTLFTLHLANNNKILIYLIVSNRYQTQSNNQSKISLYKFSHQKNKKKSLIQTFSNLKRLSQNTIQMIINLKAKAMNFELKKLIQSNASNITSIIAKIRNISF